MINISSMAASLPLNRVLSMLLLRLRFKIYQVARRKYVMWFHLELSSQGCSAARMGVAVIDEPTGTLEYLNPTDLMQGFGLKIFREEWKFYSAILLTLNERQIDPSLKNNGGCRARNKCVPYIFNLSLFLK